MSETNNSNEVVVSIKNLQKAFGDNVVLRDIDLDVHKGEVVVVLGPSGSGKSTMLRCINRLEHPTSGSIVVEGVDVCAKGVDLNKVRTHLGMVFQQFNLFPHLSVKKNVMLAQQKVLKRSKEEAEKIAVEELTKVGLAERIDFMPSQLSGGQQQRVAIARALSMNPHVMLFDEATSALDPELVRDVLGLPDGGARERVKAQVPENVHRPGKRPPEIKSLQQGNHRANIKEQPRRSTHTRISLRLRRELPFWLSPLSAYFSI